jgi:hypothetical protein
VLAPAVNSGSSSSFGRALPSARLTFYLLLLLLLLQGLRICM